MQPYVIRQGDYLAQLAHRFGFDADAVWNDPANDELRGLRPNPNLLAPTDVLYIPDPTSSEPSDVQVGTTNEFSASDPPTTKVEIKFAANDPTKFANKAYTIQEISSAEGLTTDDGGIASFDAPVDLQTLTVVFTDSGQSFSFLIGGMDPIDTITGVFARLQNLGYIKQGRGSAIDLDVVRAGLWSFQQSLGQGSPPSSGGDDAPPSGGSDPTSGPASDPGSPPWIGNTSLMADDGTIDPNLGAQLVSAHGS